MRKAVLFICLLQTAIGWAQDYAVRHLGVERGLSSSYVVNIAEDKKGYIWFATEEGLNRLEGNRFVSFYKSSNGNSITGNELNCLLDDPDPDKPILWIGTQRAGLNAYNYETRSFTIYQHDEKNPHSLITNDITDIQAASDGNLWIGTYWWGVDYFDKKSGHFTHYNKNTVKGMPENNTWSVVDDGKGSLYIGHVREGLSVLRIADKSIQNFKYEPGNEHSLPGNEVLCIFCDKGGLVWVGTDRGLAMFDPETKRFIRLGKGGNALSHRVYDIRQLNENQIWVALEFGGIAILDASKQLFTSPENYTFEYIKEGSGEQGLNGSTVRCLFQDSYKNIWAGIWGGGIDFLSHFRPWFNNYTHSVDQSTSKLTNRIASAIVSDLEGKLWIGTDGNGINVLKDGVRIATYSTDNGSLKGNSVQAAFRDSKGNLWFGLFWNGIARFNESTRSFTSIPLSEHYEDVRCFYEDDKGKIWVGSSNGIYTVNRETGSIEAHYNCPNNLIRALLKDEKGRLWVGTYGGGLFVYNAKMELLQTFNTALSFTSNSVEHLFEDSQMNIWVATGEGLVCFTNGGGWKYKAYQRENGLANTYIRAITEDSRNNIWFSTNKGISCLLSKDQSIFNYTSKDNIPQSGFKSGCVYNDGKEYIYFGTLDGVCYFDPEYVLQGRETPQAVINAIRILKPITNEGNDDILLEMNEQDKIELRSSQNNLSIAFNVQNFAQVDMVEYAYMLKGLEDSWYTASAMNEVTFRNLPPGNYHFLIKTRMRNQDWSDKTTELNIVINSPLWLSWWAKLIYVILALIILVESMRFYQRKLKLEYMYQSEKKSHEQEQELIAERLRFFTNITHELRTPLTLILGPLEDMTKSTELSAKDHHRISVIHQSAIRLLNLINQILEFRKTETQNKKLCVCRGNIASVIYEIGLKYKELNRNPKISIEMEVEREDMELYFDKEVINIVLDNLISNALKYTEEGSVTISVGWEEKNGVRYAVLQVKDTGYGINPEALPHIFDRYYQEKGEHQASGTGIGLALVQNLVKLHEGEIGVESQLNVGTAFHVRLIADNTYPNALHADEESQRKEETTKEDTPVEVSGSSRPLVLVVEDNDDIREYIADSFTDLYEVKTAANGQIGLNIALECVPDVVVSDIMMPVMNGITLCKKLKEDMRTSHIPIILLTAKDSLADKEEGYQSGADSYLTKPFSASLLQSRINNLLAQRRHLSEKFSIRPDVKNAPSQNLEEKRAAIAESLSKLDREFLEKINNVIMENLSSAENIDITMLSNVMCMSSSTLYRKMKALTGMSTNEYVRKVKIQLAEKLLLEGKYTISEIAFKVGINSTVYFRQCFKEEFGLSPSEYLKQIKQ